MPARLHADPAGRGEILAWCLYDFANSSFTTLVVSFLYATFFTDQMVPDRARGTAIWSWAIAVSAVLIALLSPVLGSLADAVGRRRPLLAPLTLVCIAGTTVLAFIPPPRWALAWVLFVAANVAYECAGVLYNAYLPELASPERIGRISGYGWGLGYAGGLACLVLAFFLTGLPDSDGGWHLEPLLSTAAGWNLRATNLLVAGWFLAFSLPMLVAVRERGARSGLAPTAAVRSAFAELGRAWRQVRRYRQAVRFLAARLLYNDGLVTVFAFGGIFAAGAFGMSFGEIVLLGIWLNLAAGAGALALGHLDDRIGGRATVMVTVVALLVATLLAAAAPDRTWFWIAATAVGIMVGPNQAASRSLMGRFAPAARRGEFFGFYAFSGKATAFLGPLLLGQATAWTGSQRWGVASQAMFFIAGLWLLLRVDERAGVEAAAQDPPH